MAMNPSIHPQSPTACPLFASRQEAAALLASRLAPIVPGPDTVVLALPGGGVEVGRQIASELGLSFDILVVAPITSPRAGREPLGALTGGGVRMLNFELIDRLHLTDAELRLAILRHAMRVSRRELLYRDGRPSLDLADRPVILADDGGSRCEMVRHAVRLLHRLHVDRIIVAAPVACHEAACDLGLEVDAFVTLSEPEATLPPSAWFLDFPRTSAAKVQRLMRSAV